MEITLVFGATFADMMRAKLRHFFRRSLLRYAVGAALIAFGLHGLAGKASQAEIAVRGIVYFLLLCAGVLVLHVIAAFVQSRRQTPRQVTFSESDIVVTQQGETVRHGWPWILAAQESNNMLALQIQRSPPRELFLPKSKLPNNDYQTLRGWLVAHGKLAD